MREEEVLAAAHRLQSWFPPDGTTPGDDHPYWLVNCHIDCGDVRKVVEFVLAMAQERLPARIPSSPHC